MLIVAGYTYVDPTDLEKFVADSRALLADARTEEGCLFISFTLDDPEAGSMLVLERWRDQAAHDAHLAKPEVVATFAKWAGKLGNEVRKYDAFNERPPLD